MPKFSLRLGQVSDGGLVDEITVSIVLSTTVGICKPHIV